MRPGDLVCIGYSGGTASTSLVHLLKVILYSRGTASTSLVHLLKVILYSGGTASTSQVHLLKVIYVLVEVQLVHLLFIYLR